jgi:exonuclease III
LIAALVSTGLLSWNTHGLSLYARSPAARSRRRRIAKQVKRSGKGRFVFLQETKANKYESSGFDDFMPNHKVFYNNKSKNVAGTLIAVPLSLLNWFEAREVPLPGFASGYAQVVSLTAKGKDLPALFLINLYLPSYSDTANEPILRELAKLRYGVRVLMAGDYNFTEDAEDGSHQLAGGPLSAWDRTVNRLLLREVRQPADTFFGPDKVSSHIDRVYTSYTEADQSLYALEAFVLARPHLGPELALAHRWRDATTTPWCSTLCPRRPL